MKYDLILIDGMHLMHRAAHSYKGLGVHRGDIFIPTGSIYGFLLLSLKVWRTYGGPKSRMVICWDAGYDHRLQLYPEYKANRRKASTDDKPDDIKMPAQKEILDFILKNAGWSQARSAGYEADDVMGTFARKGEGTVAIYTGDQDLHQIVDSNIHVISSNKGKDVIWDLEKVMEKWGVPPSRIPEAKGLAGDGGDNIPGCPGCGLGWARKLLSRYDTLDQVIEAAQVRNLSGFYDGKAWKSPSLTKKVRENARLIKVSRDLAEIVQCPLEIFMGTPNPETIREVFQQLRFSSLLKEETLSQIMSLSQ